MRNVTVRKERKSLWEELTKDAIKKIEEQNINNEFLNTPLTFDSCLMEIARKKQKEEIMKQDVSNAQAKLMQDTIKEAMKKSTTRVIPNQDNVNHPSHYTTGDIETIDYIKDKLTQEEFEGYCIGNVTKYLSRWRTKNGKEDLLKAQWYLNKCIEEMN